MKENKILNYFQIHQNTCYKQTFSMLSNKDNNFATALLSQGRNIRNTSQNKCGPLSKNIGWTLLSQNTFIYRMKLLYNRLPMQITLSPDFASFKKWILAYPFNNDIKFPVRKDNSYFIHNQYIDINIISNCFNTT